MLSDLPPDVALSLLALWLSFIGAAVGSFLNVVIYRVPAGISIVRPGSHCPICKHPIRWYDNIPVLSWIVLRAHCRDCRAPISVRYPLVEAATAALFLLLAAYEVFDGAKNLPVRATDSEGFTASASQLFGIYAYHLGLLCTLLAAAMIGYDGKRPPLMLFLPALAVGLVTPLIWPELHPVPALPGLALQWWDGLIDGIAGLLTGVALAAAGCLVGQVANVPGSGRLATCPTIPGKAVGCVKRTTSTRCSTDSDGSVIHTTSTLSVRFTHPTIVASACAGVYLGWQAALVLLVLAAAIHQALRLAARRLPGLDRLPWAAWLGLGSLLWILFWARIAAGLAIVHLGG
jgi:prepilin signal peptidase PulO-like enzyme (type II secretory pathway)